MLWNVSSILQRAKHLATCQLSCNVTTASRCAIFDQLQEKIRIESRPVQKVTGKSSEQSIKSVSQAACACVGQKFHPVPPLPSPPPPHHPTTPKIITRSFVDNVVKRFKHLATCKASRNLLTILQPHSQHLRNAPQKVTGKSSEQSIKSVSQAACACVGQKFPSPSPHPAFPPTPPPQK